MRVAMVVNPRSGRNSGLAVAKAAEGVLTAGGWQVARLVTEAPGQAAHLASQAAAEGHDIVFACGGDGTLSEVVQGMLGTGVPAGLIPAGSGNDFARTTGLSRRADVAAQQALHGAAEEIDLLEVDGGRLWGLNVIGVGFDAQVAARINRRLRVTAGATAYVTAVVQELAYYRPLEVRVRCGRHTWEGRALLVAIANAQCYGAGMRIAPHADIMDGLLDVVLVEHLSRLAFVRAFPRVFRGTHEGHPAVRMWQATDCSVETEHPQPVLIDGDIRTQTPLQVRLAPRKARFWMPGGPAPAVQRLRLEPTPEA
jgi:YegS/Rv2252/BmrU family lipid kinase